MRERRVLVSGRQCAVRHRLRSGGDVQRRNGRHWRHAGHRRCFGRRRHAGHWWQPSTGGTPGTGGVGGTPGTGGTTGGSSGAGPTGGTGGIISGNPPGWWTHASWHGCPWTGIDTVAGTTTTNTPRDFITHQAGMGYCVSGNVHGDYDSVALLGFNLNETPNGSATQCAYNPAAATAMGPPGVALTGSGIAINFTKANASVLRVQVQGPNGATDPMNRWCATITPAAGPVFVPWTAFNTECWEGGMGSAFTPGDPISAVAFLVPGTMGAVTPFNYCINGFATGAAASDAPTWGTGGGGPLTGTIGGPGGMNLDFQRVKVSKGGKSYIIQNNNWGNPNGSDQQLSYSDNSFRVVSSNGNGSQHRRRSRRSSSARTATCRPGRIRRARTTTCRSRSAPSRP